MNHRFKLDHSLLIILIIFALILRVGMALKFPNIFWADEIFQSLEPAHRLAFGNGIVTWEFRDGIRSWVLPGILAGIMRLTAWMGKGSTGYLIGINIFLSLLSLSNILIAYLWGKKIGGTITAFICAAICTIWFELIYFSPKAFTEVVATHFLLPGVYLGVEKQISPTRNSLFLSGCLLGISLAFRIHFIPAIVFAVVYICRKDWREKWLPIMLGIIAPILIFGTIDAFTWSYPFQSFWLNIWVNIVEGRSKLYGVSPWYEYLIFLLKSWSWLSLPIIILALIGSRHSPILVWLVLIIILSHSLLAHKEYRFIYPVLPMVMILAGIGTGELVLNLSRRWVSHKKTLIAILLCLLLWTSISIALLSRFNIYSPLKFSTFGTNLENTHLFATTNNLLALQSLSTENTVCGLGLWGIHWALSGGYTYFHRDVPIYPVDKAADFEKLKPGFNYIVANISVPSQYQNYTLQKCWQGTCVYKRPGSCRQIIDRDINYVLKKSGN
ncbi:mannosyltransferase [Anabaena cylindrica FACHB-243]|uniref:Alg9 family protein mannosyltransferase n=1 Tax=Anabaena cylindrica (strain ATCC 27899 / PCC 7122) TaxID=272123 RepID=K9ZGR2_ANACC|nr:MULTISPECIES: mannosyltransferase [Anabaena]AFZ57949.1 Alg9 family protein mannosyltransferase [Anabaena cylindrica PCC 7122]MBD2419696.1 mannosyltransferase [Anabaena cylindrica FACHB-243]MBY5281601.1 mannosyltransferase [Anabaena sp. CCAP 1446/1C]MBY5307146.1 mannosyltransferase [Anabaena sp. CCAP 1446/1C]MCM2409216.1 mannosyltransferase [Anabaena sp. CCAP 1446/1C]